MTGVAIGSVRHRWPGRLGVTGTLCVVRSRSTGRSPASRDSPADQIRHPAPL